MFKTFDKTILNHCMFYLNLLPVRYEYLFRKAKFLINLMKSKNSILSKLFVSFGSLALVNICTDLNLETNCKNIFIIKRTLWEEFENSLILT